MAFTISNPLQRTGSKKRYVVFADPNAKSNRFKTEKVVCLEVAAKKKFSMEDKSQGN